MPLTGDPSAEFRFNAILGKYVPSVITAEEVVVAAIPEQPGKFGFRLVEFPLKPTDPSTISIPSPGMVISGLTLVSTDPADDEFRPDWFSDASPIRHRTSLVYVHEDLDGQTLEVAYYGGGGANIVANFMQMLLASIISAVGALVTVKPTVEILTDATGSWNKPANILPGSAIIVETIGDGGGGAGTSGGGALPGGGGGGGGRSRAVIPESSLSAPVTYSVGQGGVGGSGAGTDGGDGSGSGFGGMCEAGGGGGGKAASPNAGGTSGVGSNGDENDGLGDGHPGEGTGGTDGKGGNGGGPGGRGGESAAGSNGKGYGGGGGGGGGNGAVAGGNGMQGIIRIQYWTIEEAV